MTKIVERLIGHAASERTVTDDGNDVSAIGVLTVIACDGHAIGITEHGRGVTVFDEVVNAFFTTRIARNSAGLTQVSETTATTRHDFVHVRLMACVPQDCVAWRLENSV